MDINSIKELLHNPIIGTGVLVTMMGSIFYSLKGIPKQVFKTASTKISNRFVYTVRIFQYDDLFDLFEKWLQKNHQKEYRDVEGKLFSSSAPFPEEEPRKAPAISYSQSVNIFTLVVNGKRLFISKQREELKYAQSFKDMFGYHYSIKGFMAKETITKLLQSIVNEHYAQFPQNQVRIRVNDEYGNWNTLSSITCKGLEKIIIDPEKKQLLISDIETFKSSKEWYNGVSIPYKRTYCFHGGPGTGKTSLSLAIAAHLKRDLYILNPSSLENDAALQHAFGNIACSATLLVEDIDASFIKRESTKSISFSCLLNCFDGAFYKEGLVTCITTNHLDKLDPALLRAGRTDMIMEIGLPKVMQIEEFLSLFYEHPISIDCDCENILLPMSAIQEICISNRNDELSTISTIKSQLLSSQVFA